MLHKQTRYKPCPRTRVGSAGDKKRRISHIVVETTSGQIVQKDEVVHHINEDIFDNRPENLQVMTKSEYMKLHHPKDYSRFGISAAEDKKTWSKYYREELREKQGKEPRRMITKQEYFEIKALIHIGIFQAKIAERYGINPSTISRINTNNFRYQKYEMKGV